MKQLVVLSGKGGTGKTSVCAAFAHLSADSEPASHSIFVDADVDASNLSLVLQPEIGYARDFLGGSLAFIASEHCVNCGACAAVCRYEAIGLHPSGKPVHWIDPLACDGCAACIYACPAEAIQMVQQQEGLWFQSNTPYGTLFHAELFAGKENSGKLVTLIKQMARLNALETNGQRIIIDGPPGIGCPVISACAGADLGLIVTEPGRAGFHDLKRVLDTLQHFRIPAAICVNKSDLYSAGTDEIRQFSSSSGIQIVGEIPYDESIPQAMLEGKPVTLVSPESSAARSIKNSWLNVLDLLSRLENKR